MCSADLCCTVLANLIRGVAMANIEERKTKDGRAHYRVLVRLKGHPAQSATFERKTDAKKWAQQTEAAIREGRHFKTTEAKRHTLADMIDRYVREVLPHKQKSYAKQKAQLDWWKDQIGPYCLADVTPALIAEQRDKLTQGVTVRGTRRSGSTANRYLAALSHVFSLAVKEWGWLDSSPLQKVRKHKEPRGRVRFLSDDERQRLLRACKESTNPYLYTVVVLALSTGGRRMEIMRLTWEDVDLQKGVLRFQDTKNGERRAVPVTGHARDLLDRMSKVRRIDTKLLFPGSNPQQPIDLRAPWEAALTRAQITDFLFHDLRHSAASYLAMTGASLAAIAEVLGHKTLQMVKRYAHLSEQHTTQVVANMTDKIFGAGT